MVESPTQQLFLDDLNQVVHWNVAMFSFMAMQPDNFFERVFIEMLDRGIEPVCTCHFVSQLCQGVKDPPYSMHMTMQLVLLLYN